MKFFLTFLLLTSASTGFASDPQMSHEVAICGGSVGSNPKKFNVYRDSQNKNEGTVLYTDLSDEPLPYSNILFTGAEVVREKTLLKVKHPKLNLVIDLASENGKRKFKGKLDDQVELNCEIITPIID